MKTGIWLDRHEAVIINIDESDSKIDRILSSIETRPRVEGESKEQTRFGDTYGTHETSNERRTSHQRKEYFNAIRTQIGEEDELLLFGPGEERIAFWKFLRSADQSEGMHLHTITADSMTDPQKVAFVRRYFKMELPRILPNKKVN